MRTRRLALTAAVFIVLGGAGCGQPAGPAGEKPSVAPPASTTPWASSPPVDDPSARANRVAEFARRHSPDTFAGVALDDSGQAVRVYRKPDPVLDQAVTAEFPDIPLEFVDAARSERDLNALVQEILDSTQQWEAQGVRLRGVGPDFVNGRVRVTSPDPALAADRLKQRYGDAVEVVAGDVAHPTITAQSRR